MGPYNASALFFALALVSASTALGKVAEDSTGTVEKPPVEIVVSADTILLRRSAIDRTVITAEQLRAKAPYQLQEVISDVPGVFVRQYGGMGGLATVSVRGGSAAQSLVMLDGVRLNTVQTGAVDISTIPLSMIRRIDVQRGSLGAVNGANAMTGSMDLRLAVPATGMRLQASAGSFDSWKGAWQGALRHEAFAVGAAVEAYGSAGSYPYQQEVDGENISINRQNGAVHSASGLLRVDGPAQSRLTFVGRHTSRGVPGPVVPDVVTQTNAQFDDLDVLGIAGGNVVHQGAHTIRLDGAMRYIDQRYVDPSATITGPQGIDTRFLARDAAAYATWTVLDAPFTHTTKLNAGFADLRGASLQPNVGDHVIREQVGLGYQLAWSMDAIEASLAARVERYSDVGNALAGGLGVAWIASPALTWRANLGSGYRAASFSEMYFLNYGNANLKPERSVMGSLGTHWLLCDWLFVDASAFASAITDLIVSVPINPVVTSAQNVGKASSVGLELGSTALLLHNRLTASWNYTVQDVRDRTGRPYLDGTPIVYVPVEMIHAQVQWKDQAVMGRLEWSYTSHRYAQAGGEITSVLPPYHLVNAVVGTTIQGAVTSFTLQLRVDNIFDVRYAVVRGYPMPGTMVRLNGEVTI